MSTALRDQRLVLVTGATGYVGGRLVPRLLQEGYRVRCFVRDPARVSNRGWEGAEVAKGDVLAPPTLEEAMAGVSDAYYLVHSMASGEKNFAQRDRVGAANFRNAASCAGVGRIIYLGGLAHPGAALSPHLQSRQETGEILRAGPVPVTEFRASVIVGSGSRSFEMIRYLTERIPLIVAPLWLRTKCQPIAIRNVLQYLVACLEEPGSTGKIFEIGGEDVLSYQEMMAIYAQERGLKRRIMPYPLPTLRLFSYWVSLFTPIPSSVARLLIEGLRNESVCDDVAVRGLFPIQLLSYREAVKLALDRIRRGNVETVWTGAYSSTPRELPPPVVLASTEGMNLELRHRVVAATADKTFDVVARIGGEQGWYFWNWIWRLRGFMDRVAGGVGFRRGRRNPVELRVGDPLDFWRVEVWDPPRLMRLRAEMRLPGLAWLQFEVIPRGRDRALLKQTAFFEPKGLWGLLYWYALYPIHRVIFSGLIKAITRRAESIRKKA